MQRTRNILFNITIALNCLLVFLLLFESRLVLPVWLQVTGRTHPLILHFPVVLVILYAFMQVLFFRRIREDESYRSLADGLLILAALTSVLTALAGLFLSREEGYDPEALLWHKWSGFGVAILTLGLYYFRNQLYRYRLAAFTSSFFSLCIIILAGHQGAGITHGQNFLLAPLLPEKKEPDIAFEEAVVYTHLIKPILESKCFSCHNEKKAKGELVMETEALLLKGGKTGVLWDTTAADLGLLLRRVHLPLEAKKHMPPQGKPQLTEDEITLITQWIRKGADFKLRAIELDPADTLRLLAQAKFAATELAAYDFEAADASKVRELNTVNRVITEESLSSPALNVSFFNSQLFKPEQLKELLPLKKQIVSLDVARMPLTDADIRTVSEFENLRKLNLSFTPISGTTLIELKKLKYLKSISVAGTKITANVLKQLTEFPQLRVIHTWNTNITEVELQKIRSDAKQITFENGFKDDTTRLKLSPPVLKNEEVIITAPVPLQLKHYINGTEIRYTLDGTDPDSLRSPVFSGKETIDGNVLLRAKAFKPGWISSELLEASFYKNTYTPDSVIFFNSPDLSDKDDSKLLIDQVKGETNFRNGNWLAWRKSSLDIGLPYRKPVSVSSVTISALKDIGSYIMPPVSIEIWGGGSPGNLKLLGKLTPEQPKKMEEPVIRGYEVRFPPTTVSYLRIKARPVSQLPSWHPGKGDKGWIFTDEVLVN